MQASGVRTPTLTQWSTELKYLANDVGTFSNDATIMFDQHLPGAQIHTHIFDVLKQMNQELSIQSNPQLYQQFKDVKGKLVKLLRDRTQYIERGATQNSDRWTKRAEKLDKVAAEPLMRASASFQDLRFIVEEVCEHHLEKFKKLAVEDIENFKKKINEWVQPLSTDAKEKRQIQDVLEKNLSELVDATKNLDADKAKAAILKISAG
jgi:hypothetical protein